MERKYYEVGGHTFYQEELTFEEILRLMDIIDDSKEIIKDTSFVQIIKKVIRAKLDITMRIILKPKNKEYTPPEGFFNGTPGTIGMEVIADFFSFNPPESYSHSIGKIIELFKPVLKKMGIEISLSDIKNTLKNSSVDSQMETSQKEAKYLNKK